MLAVERRKQILEQVHKDKKVIVSELSRQFRVSEETIRRDLEKLAEDGHVIKSYGGAVINEIGSIDLPFNVRWKSNSIGKQHNGRSNSISSFKLYLNPSGSSTPNC